MSYDQNSPLGQAIDAYIEAIPERDAMFAEASHRDGTPGFAAAFAAAERREKDDLYALQTAFHKATKHLNPLSSCRLMNAEAILKCAGGRKVPASVQVEIQTKNGKPELVREDLRLKPFAEHLGFDTLTSALSDAMVPSNGYSFERGNLRIWGMGARWMAAEIVEGSYSNHRHFDDLLTALAETSGVTHAEAVRVSDQLAARLVKAASTPSSARRPR